MMVEGVYGGLGDGVLAEEFDNYFFLDQIYCAWGIVPMLHIWY